MEPRLLIQCPLCHMKQFDNENSPPPLRLPEIKIMKITSTGDKGIKNHKFDLSEFPEGEMLEREILERMKIRMESLMVILELRLREI